MDGIHSHSVTHLLATLFEHMIKFLLLMSTVHAISLAICCAIYVTLRHSIRVRKRFEFQVGHSNQSMLGTDQKTLLFFPTCYQNYE